MARLPFNPDNIPTRDVGPPARRERHRRKQQADAPKPMSISQACELIKGVLADHTPSPIRVVGEVSNFSDRNHWFLSLKDEQNILPCVMWASAARKCPFTPERGQQVVATGRIDFYGPQGRLQLYIDRLDPVGQGVLEQRYRQLCEELRGLGYFQEDRKQPLPAYPMQVAVVTSGGGAALHDVIRTARQRWPAVRLTLVDVRVQGEAAAPEVARAVTALGTHHERFGIDAMILTRGGGSLEDLWAFNERIVADAICDCPLPIVAAIGHETDTTIAELVADLRCSTPTQAAARLLPDAAAERQRIDQLASRLTVALRRTSRHARTHLEALARHPLFRSPTEPIDRRRGELTHLRHRLRAAVRQNTAGLREQLAAHRHTLHQIEPVGRLRLARHQLQTVTRQLTTAATQQTHRRGLMLDALSRELAAISPENVLRRGYSYTTTPDDRIIQSVHQLRPGDPLITHLLDGEVRSEVIDEKEPRRQSSAKTSRRRSKPQSRNTPNLFE